MDAHYPSLGVVDPSTVEKAETELTDADKARLQRAENRPPLQQILNLHDFEVRHYYDCL